MHKLRNLLAKLPERLHREVKARYWAALDEARSPAQATAALQALARDYRAGSPSFARALEDDLDALVVHQRFPSEYRRRVRSTNLLERTFVEVRRRTKVIGPPRRGLGALPDLGRARARQLRLARRHHDP